MRPRQLALFAAVVASTVGSSASASSFSLDQPVYAADSAPARKPLMAALDRVGLAQPLEDNGISISGVIEGSWSHGLTSPANGIIAGHSFDFEHDDPTLNQIYVAVEKTTDYKKAWDIGGKMAWTYGGDARFIHSNGLLDHERGDRQIDLTELYGEVVVPVGNGLKLKFGKFITPLGFEYVNPSLNAFYSHTFIFDLVPYSHTGVLGSYAIDDNWSVSAGLSRGWDQSLEDNNDSIDFIGSVGFTKDDISSALSFTVGPELADNNGDYRVAIDWWFSAQLSEQWTASVNADYIWEQNSGQDGDASDVFGVAGYLNYAVCKYATLNARVEWFCDTNRAAGADTAVYELTFGSTFTPFADNELGSNLKIRPEIRFDIADDPVFDGGTDDSQTVFAIDAYFTF